MEQEKEKVTERPAGHHPRNPLNKVAKELLVILGITEDDLDLEAFQTHKGHHTKQYYANKLEAILYASAPVAGLYLAALVSGKVSPFDDKARYDACKLICSYVLGYPIQRVREEKPDAETEKYYSELMEVARKMGSIRN